MALQSQAQLLDELMGKNRNVAPGVRINSIRFDDEDVCKYALCGFCPHDLFVNTRADLGPCDKIHDEELKKQYEKSSRYSRLGYEDDFERFIRGLLMDVEKKIKRGVERLKLTQSDPNQKTPAQVREEKIADLKEKINAIIKEAEHLGEEGKIEEAQATLESCEKLKTECKYLEIQHEQNLLLIEQKQMEVCEVCGSFLIVNDAQARVEEHISGKQHMGYAKLRSALEDIRKKRAEEFEKREKERSSSRSDRHRDRDRRDRRDDREDRDRNRDRDRDRDRERSDRKSGETKRYSSRDRSPGRSSKRNGESNNGSTRRTRSRSKDRKSDHKRHRSKSRSRSRDVKHHKNESNSKTEDSSKEKQNGNGNDSKNDKTPKREASAANEEKKELVKYDDDDDDDDDMDEGEIRGA